MPVFGGTAGTQGSNAAQFDAGKVIAFEDLKNQEILGNLPHNTFSITNRDATSTLYIFLDKRIDEDKPDFVLFPEQSIHVAPEDGVTFRTLFIKNTHATNNIAADQVKVVFGTVK